MKTRKLSAVTAATLALTLPAFSQDLLIDFNSNQSGGGDSSGDPDPKLSVANHNQEGYQSYHANHEVIAEFVSTDYDAFGTSITFTPSWPDTTDRRVQQSIDRGNNFDANWVGDKINLVTDFIGIDTRTGNGGNGNVEPFAGDTQEQINDLIEFSGTRMDFTLAGLPAGTYNWLSYHHDTEHVNTPFYVDLSTDGGVSFTRIFNPNPDPDDPDATEFMYWEMTDSTNGGNPESTQRYTGDPDPDPANLPSTVRFQITTDGSDVVVRFIPLSRVAVHEQILAVNGFELTDSTDSDNDNLPDWWENANFGNLAQDGSGDPDNDFSNNAQELARNTDPNDNDSDDDTLLDGHESGSGTWDSATETGTNPLAKDTDGDGLDDNVENPDLPFVDENQTGSDPNLADTDGDLHPDAFEVSLDFDPGDGAVFPRMDGLFVDFSNTPSSHEFFYQGFVARHETNADSAFDPDNGDPENGIDREETFIAFGTDVTLGVSYPDISDFNFPEESAQVKQMIDRGVGPYDGTLPNLMRDWIGVDARIGSFGNGDFEPTSLTFTLTGLPDGAYVYRAFHHDTGNQNGPFDILITDADRTDAALNGFKMTASPTTPGVGNGPETLASTVNIVFRSNGTDPVTITYQVFEDLDDATQSFIAVNGFEITQSDDSDNDGLPDAFELENFGNLAQSGTDDFDEDGANNAAEFAKGTDATDNDTDDDGLLDGEEVTALTDPFIADTDGDGVDDGPEVKTFLTDPLVGDSDEDGYSDGREVAAGSDPNDFDSLPLPEGALLVDFNSLTQGGGPNGQLGYEYYEAGHEIVEDFIPAEFDAFGATVTFTPSWPDSFDNRTVQMIDRGGGNDANWNGDQIDLLTDWIGVDTRTGNGGNGNYSLDAEGNPTGTPTRMLFTFEGLPAGEYAWRSYHHDTEHMNADFLVEISTDGGNNFTQIVGPGQNGRFRMTDSTPGGAPASPMTYDGPGNPGSFDPADLPSTVDFTFTATGDDVVIQWTPLADTGVHRQFLGVNGFELAPTSPVAPQDFRINTVNYDSITGEVTLTWDTKPNKTYSVFFSPDLKNAPGTDQWFELTDGLTVGTFTDALPVDRPVQRNYKVEEIDQ